MGNPQPSSKGTYGSPLTPPFFMCLRVKKGGVKGNQNSYECSSETKW